MIVAAAAAVVVAVKVVKVVKVALVKREKHGAYALLRPGLGGDVPEEAPDAPLAEARALKGHRVVPLGNAKQMHHECR